MSLLLVGCFYFGEGSITWEEQKRVTASDQARSLT